MNLSNQEKERRFAEATNPDFKNHRANSVENALRLLGDHHISPLPWRVSTCEKEPDIVCIADANDQIVAKFGPLLNPASSMDAMLVAAMVNGAYELLKIAEEKMDEGYDTAIAHVHAAAGAIEEAKVEA